MLNDFCRRSLTALILGLNSFVLLATPAPCLAQNFTTDVTIQNGKPVLVLNNDGTITGTPRIWEVGADSNWFVKDVTADSNVMIMKPDCLSASIVLAPNGLLGFGTYFPGAHLHVSTDDSSPRLRLESKDSQAPHVWDLTGSAEGFDLVDATNANAVPFSVRTGAPTGTMYLANTGDVGFGTSSPVADLHVFRSNSAKLRLESDLGFGSQSWDIVGDGSGFAIVDPNTPATTLKLTSGGNVGIGTATPDANSKLDIRSTQLNGLLVKRTTAGPNYLRLEDSTGSVFRCGVQGNGDTQFGALTPGKGLALMAGGTGKLVINAAGQVSFGSTTPANPSGHALIHSSGAHLTTGGVWTSVSSRAAKQDIEPITSDEARETVRALQPVGYRYKNELDERYVGFIAEDVPELVATNDRKGLASMDITAVLTKVVQDQDKQLDSQDRVIKNQERKLTDQEQRLIDERQRNDKLERLVVSLMQRVTSLEQRHDDDSLPQK